MKKGYSVRFTGLVQGVGFRPVVYQVARKMGLNGTVLNDSQGVLVNLWCDDVNLKMFIDSVKGGLPSIAHIERIITTEIQNDTQETNGFEIRSSVSGKVHTNILPDISTCSNCHDEFYDNLDRRYLYPLINCMHCGPRFSIISAIPYDRKNTSMASFKMCKNCEEEYQNINKRRFHAQPNACLQCGPQIQLFKEMNHDWEEIFFSKPNMPPSEMKTVFQMVTDALSKGKIVAIKGIGGYHLACDAYSDEACQKLRKRKRRPRKPFALMAGLLKVVSENIELSDLGVKLLKSPSAPIILGKKLSKTNKKNLSDFVAPKQKYLGFMLPYSQLHKMLFEDDDRILVMTSANTSHEPQCYKDSDAFDQLKSVADMILLSDRPILRRLDDSVIQVEDKQFQILRRARGFVPSPIQLPSGFEDSPAITGFGGHLKNTFCLLKDGKAFLSQHMGDLDNHKTKISYTEAINDFHILFEHEPKIYAVDLHPDYLSSKVASTLSLKNNTPILGVQHHHSHFCSCLADNQIELDTPPILGIILDGLGYAENGALWGGEFFWGDYCFFERLGALEARPLPGGEASMKEPWRNLFAQLLSLKKGSEDMEFVESWQNIPSIQKLKKKNLSLLKQAIKNNINCPLSSSAGRLFDAVSATLDICFDQNSYEAEAAILLEACTNEARLQQVDHEKSEYPFEQKIKQKSKDEQELIEISSVPMWNSLLNDIKNNVDKGLISARFHIGFVEALIKLVKKIRTKYKFDQVVLSGGVMQNQIISQKLVERIETSNLTPLTHKQVPANDGGISLGQVASVAAKSILGRN